MLLLYIAIFFLVALAVTYAFLVMPRSVDVADMDMQSTDYAHRGLHGKDTPENSLAAFSKAKDAGYGITLDVALTADGHIVTIRDDGLKRACGISRGISSLSYSQLTALRIKGSNEHIPLLSEVLELIDGHVPILIEIERSPVQFKLCKQLCELMDTYVGAFSICSMDPEILRFFKKYRPRYARGQIVTRGKQKNTVAKHRIRRFARVRMLTNVISRPDFILTDGNHTNKLAFFLATRVFNAKGFVWNVRSDAQYAICRKKGFYAVFDNIRPQ